MNRRATLRLTFAALSAALLLVTYYPVGAQAPAGSDHTAHLKAWDVHKAMAAASPYKAMNWSYIGPTNIAGRVTDVAVSDHGTSRRLYAGSCCGGVWASDDLGQTWQPVFDKEASTSTGALAVAPSNPDILWIGTGESNIFRSSYTGVGVYKSTDNAKTFQHMGLTDTGTIGRIVVHPTDPNIVYVASAGQEWVENEMRGVFKTTDGGKTWTHALKISQKTGVNDIAMDPGDPNTLYAAAWQRQRRKWNDPRVEEGFNESLIYKTTDAGKTWTKLTSGLPPSNASGRIGIAIARSNPNVVYAFYDNYECDTQPPAPNAQGRGSNPGGSAAKCAIKGNEVYRSNDKGATWTKVSGQNDDDAQKAFMKGMSNTYAWVFGNIRVDPTNENTVYTLALGVSVSRDGGKTFARFTGPATPPAPPAAAAAGAPPAGGGRGGPGGDNHAMWIDPKNPLFMLSGNDSGFRVTTDGGATWRRAPLPTETAFSMAYDMDTPFRVYGSFQDHGSYRGVVDIRNGRDNLQPIAFEGAPGGEYCEHAIDPRNPNIVYSGKLDRTDFSIPAVPRGGGAGGGGGAGRAAQPAPTGPQRDTNIRPPNVTPDDPLRMQVLAPILLSPHDADTVYFGAQYLFRSKDRGTTWEKLTDDLSYNDKTKRGDIPHQLVITISESPKKKGLVYTGTDDGRLYASIDDGKEWRELTLGGSSAKKEWIGTVLASKYDEATVYAAQQGRYDEDFAVHLYKSTDYGKTWKSIAGNLPGGPINMIREDPVSPNVLYTANDFGVYVTTNGGQKWDVLGGNLPSVNVMDFIVHPRDRMLVIGTHGRGVWTIDVSKIGGR
ncbi:MAG TPA: hypothetical protein VJN96_26310 [Vicinamibacterales bacterium]|nr:hypothetical protein [Vicinamibacterales bacterium]